MVKAVIVQSNGVSRGFDEYIKGYGPHLDVLGRAGTVMEGISLIRNERPNLVLLDVELPDGSGFEVFEATRDLDYEKIILSEEKRYVFKAYRFDVADYLVKPLAPQVLRNSLERLFFARKEGLIQKMYEKKFCSSFPLDSIFVDAIQGSKWIELNRLVRVHDDNVLRTLSLNMEQSLLTTQPMSRIKMGLPKNRFFRLNRTDMIGIDHLMGWLDDQTIEMRDGAILTVPEDKIELLQGRWNNRFPPCN